MKGIVLTSHGPMAQGLLETSKMFMGEQPQLVAKCFTEQDNTDDFVEVLKKAVEEVDTGDGVYVLCDMLFGSPCNCMARVIGADLDNDKVEVLTGMNLAMVLQILAVREADTPTVEDILNAGKDGVCDLKAVLKANM